MALVFIDCMASGIHIVVLLCSAAAIFLIASVYVAPIACLPDLKRKIPLLWFSMRLFFFFLFKVFSFSSNKFFEVFLRADCFLMMTSCELSVPKTLNQYCAHNECF